MTVKSNRELNRAVLIGGIFILVMTGVAFTVGSLSNVYFTRHGRVFEGRVTKMVDAEKGHAFIQLMNKSETGEWSDVEGKVVPVVLDPQEPYLKGPVTVAGQEVRMSRGRSIAVVNAGGDPEQIIPTYIKNAMPPWYGIVFLLAMLAAAMSTLSSQFHVVGTSIGRDVYEQCSAHPEHITQRRSILVVRVGICIGVLIALILCWYAPAGYFIARATAIFFGLCASAFLPAFAGGLFSKRMTRAAAISSMVVGFAVTSFWLVFVKAKEAGSIGLVQLVTGGKTSILAGHPNWPEMDPLFVGLPLSILTAVVVCLLTRPPDEAHLAKCFPARAK
jgi:SSS family solute:Na+ symporter